MGDLFRYHLHTQIPYILFGSTYSYRLSMFFYAVLNDLSSFAIILMGTRELIALLKSSS